MRLNQDLKNDNSIPIFNWREVFKWKGEGEMPKEDSDKMDEYFRHFCPPGNCIKCGEQQGVDLNDPLATLLGKGRFRWGMANGEGFCSTGGCNWPARAIHRNVGPIQQFEMILQYHPSVVTFEEK